MKYAGAFVMFALATLCWFGTGLSLAAGRPIDFGFAGCVYLAAIFMLLYNKFTDSR